MADSDRKHYEGWPPAVVVKLARDVNVPYTAEGAARIPDLLGATWVSLRAMFPHFAQIRFAPLVTSIDPARIAQAVKMAKDRDPAYAERRTDDIFRLFKLRLPPRVGLDVLLAVSHLLTQLEDVVEAAYPAPRLSLPTGSGPDPHMADQYHLDPAPVGIDAHHAWTTGARGQGIRLVDVEGGWKKDHADLKPSVIKKVFGLMRKKDKDHGTAVLGILMAQHQNAEGGAGIAPDILSADLVSWWYSNTYYWVPDALWFVVGRVLAGGLTVGDVVLLEGQEDVVGYLSRTYQDMPLEATEDSNWPIATLTALGIVVVEAAGNGGNNLDNFRDIYGDHILKEAWQYNTQTVMVAACFKELAGYVMARGGNWTTNHGSRIDCFAPGRDVYTAYCGIDAYGNLVDTDTRTFDGTSAASAIIAGAALLVQSDVVARGGPRLDSMQMRGTLGAPTGTSAIGTSKVGMMPNLKLLI